MNSVLHPPHAPAPVSALASASARRPNLPALTGLRALLALGILFFHFTPPHMRFLYPVIDSGYVFVVFFFLLSGYVLAYNYAGRPTPIRYRGRSAGKCGTVASRMRYISQGASPTLSPPTA